MTLRRTNWLPWREVDRIDPAPSDIQLLRFGLQYIHALSDHDETQPAEHCVLYIHTDLVRLRAERRAGELLQEMEKNKGARRAGRHAPWSSHLKSRMTSSSANGKDRGCLADPFANGEGAIARFCFREVAAPRLAASGTKAFHSQYFLAKRYQKLAANGSVI
jgi:hypothetical protein